MAKYAITLKIYGERPEITEFLELCKKIEYLGNVGASREIPVRVDGDGSGRLRFDYGNFKIDINKAKFEKEINKNGRTVEPVYIGE